jgi:hypothetical protein
MSSASSSTAQVFHPEEAARRPFPFRRVLPVGQLLLCTLLLWPYRAWIAFELFGLRIHSSSSRVHESAPPVNFTLNADGKLDLPSDPQFQKRISAQENALDMVGLFNLPAVLVQIPYITFNESHREWMPGFIPSFAFRSWRAISWPLLALPFWWMAGRGVEALAAARRKLVVPRIGWASTLISFLIMAGGTTLAVGFVFFAGPDRADPQLRLLATASGMWGVLGSLTVVAKLAQWRIMKKSLARSVTQPSPTL